ncbi:MAG TPA: SOS response-associated peptidase family protein [Gemmataceae bacterium]
MFRSVAATPFDLDTPLSQRRAIVRRNGDDVEMVEAAWGLRPGPSSDRPITLVRAEGRTFPTHRGLVPASEFHLPGRGRAYSFSLADGDWFYLAGIWRPATSGWPESYAILTVAANEDVAAYHHRQMAVLTRAQRLNWLDAAVPEGELLRPMPMGSFRVREEVRTRVGQRVLAL